MKSILSILVVCLLPALGFAKGGDLSDYGSTSCEYGQCKVTVPLSASPETAKQDCESAYRSAYAVLKQSGKVIVDKEACKEKVLLAQEIVDGKWVGNKNVRFVLGEITFIQ